MGRTGSASYCPRPVAPTEWPRSGRLAAKWIAQGDVSKLEHRGDVLLSSLLNYLTAAGAEDARIVVTVRGQEIDLDLANLRGAQTRAQPRGAAAGRAKNPRPTGKTAAPTTSSARVSKTVSKSGSSLAATQAQATR